MKLSLLALLFFVQVKIMATTYSVGAGQQYSSIKAALKVIKNGDTIRVHPGLYTEGNIVVATSVYLQGIGFPVLDGQKKFEILSIKASNVTVTGFQLQHSGRGSLDDPGAIKVYDASHVSIINNILLDNFFGIYIQYGRHCIVRDNYIKAFGKAEQEIGNGIHCWKSDSLQITGNKIYGHRDGIYFEFVTASVIWRNISMDNIRYGLHFMFSNNDAYFTNYFKNNGAGVAVMFTKQVVMMNNTFEQNWGDAAYGLLLKEITDGYMKGNHFIQNTTGLFIDGSNRITMEKNVFINNGWGMKMQANCMDNLVHQNNFINNTFDISTNGSLTLNNFSANYWDKYEGYDINKDQVGDVPFRPLSLYALVVESNPSAMLLFRSFMISLLDKSERIIPTLTPENFIDRTPRMKAWPL